MLDYVQYLSLKDTKTIVQKALKTVEEVGELASKVLPYEGAFATTHRFVTNRNILEECADVILCALSVAYELGYNHADIDNMMRIKSDKWGMLQNKSNQLSDTSKIPFEIHITVNNVADIELFKLDCACAAVKPIVIALQDTHGITSSNDIMTSSRHIGTNQTVIEEMDRIVTVLESKGYTICRKKIETVPWHPNAPQTIDDRMPEGCYFEVHIAVQTSAIKKQLLHSIVLKHEAHLSKNAFKVIDESSYIQMITYRTYTLNVGDFYSHVDSLIEDLTNLFEINDIIKEFSIFDSHIGHDNEWTGY